MRSGVHGMASSVILVVFLLAAIFSSAQINSPTSSTGVDGADPAAIMDAMLFTYAINDDFTAARHPSEGSYRFGLSRVQETICSRVFSVFFCTALSLSIASLLLLLQMLWDRAFSLLHLCAAKCKNISLLAISLGGHAPPASA